MTATLGARPKSPRVRTYTYKVTCPLPPAKNGDPKEMTSFVYGAADSKDAHAKWFTDRLPYARKNGLRGATEQLKKSLKLKIERVTMQELR